jgi:integrase
MVAIGTVRSGGSPGREYPQKTAPGSPGTCTNNELGSTRGIVTRRGANEGTIRQRSDGRWEARALVTTSDGHRVRRSFLGRTRPIVRQKLGEALRGEAAGRPTPSNRLTVGAFLRQWLEDSVRPSTRPSTYSSYSSIVRLHLEPGLGHLPLARLSPQQVQTFLNTQSAAGLSARSVNMERAVLRQALGRAERWGLVSRNVAKLVDPPRVARRQITPFSPEQARAFLEIIREDRLEALYLVALGVGLRQGEILGLGWSDVDLDAGTLTVRQALQRVGGKLILVEPKSVTSHRTVALPALVHEALRAHRLRQLEERLRTGPRWRFDPRDLVFVSTIGTPLDGIVVTRRFQALLRAAGLPHQRFHDLRHACASLLLSQGVAARVVMEQLGHSQISLTLNTYSHVSSALGRAAAERMNDLLGRQVPMSQPVSVG